MEQIRKIAELNIISQKDTKPLLDALEDKYLIIVYGNINLVEKVEIFIEESDKL